MKLLLLILLPIQLFAQVWTDTVYHYDNLGGIRYYGEWLDRDYGKIADKRTKDSEMFYRAWLGGFDLYTYVDGHHSGYWINVDGEQTYVNLTEDQREVKVTFSVRNLSYDNHNIRIIPDTEGTFIFVKLVKFVDSSPINLPCIDTIFFDSTRWITKIRWIEKDTTIIHHVYDTITHYDTVKSRIDTVFILPKKITFELN